jgi:hypothetical protein
MIPYKNKDGKESGVIGYEFGRDSITVFFKTGERYLYTYSSAGEEAIVKMRQYAYAQKGLSTYISQNKPPYERKWVEAAYSL